MILGVIPARYGSSRFPGKPLADIRGKSMIRRVYEQCSRAEGLSEVIVATDDARIFEHVEAFGGRVEMTGDHHRSGTERVAEVAARYPDYRHCINIQGDEPLIDPGQIDLLCRVLTEDAATDIATLIRPLTETHLFHNTGAVKVVTDRKGYALYFSRAAIPYCFDAAEDARASLAQCAYFEHVGIYGFRRDVLMAIPGMAPGSLEKAENLEQLRWMEYGYRIRTAVTDHESVCIETPEDLERLLRQMS